MENNEEYQRKIYSESKGYSFEYDIKIKNAKEKSDCKEDRKKKGRTDGWNVFIRAGMVLYIIAIFIGIFKDIPSLILLGSVFSFCYSIFTSICFQRYSKGFHELTGTTLSNRGFIAAISFGIGIVAFLLEYHLNVISWLMQLISCSIDTFNSLLMGISLLVLFFDSRQNTNDLSDVDFEKIDRIEISKVIQKITPEEPPKSE